MSRRSMLSHEPLLCQKTACLLQFFLQFAHKLIYWHGPHQRGALTGPISTKTTFTTVSGGFVECFPRIISNGIIGNRWNVDPVIQARKPVLKTARWPP